MPIPSFAPAAVIDIVSFGYKKLFNSFWDLIKLSAIPFLLYAIPSGFALISPIKLQDGAIPDLSLLIPLLVTYGVMFLGSLLMMYSGYVNLRYIRDANFSEVRSNIFSYYIPDKTLLGLMGLGTCYLMAYAVAMIPLSILAVATFAIGIAFPPLIVLGIIGIAIIAIPLFLYILTFFSLASVIYMSFPKLGVVFAIGETQRLVQNNILRTVGLGFSVGLVYTLAVLPFSMLGGVSGFLSAAGTSFLNASTIPLILPLYILMILVTAGAGHIIGMGGTQSVSFRYYFDLLSRHDPDSGLMTPANVPPSLYTPPKTESASDWFSPERPAQTVEEPPQAPPPISTERRNNPWGGNFGTPGDE